MQKRWKTFPDATAEAGALARSLGVSDTLARLLWNREIRTEEAARRFLEPETRQELYEPLRMRDMERAVARIRRAVEGGEHVTIYGDYDVDGMTSTALLYGCLRSLGAAVDFYIPDRFTEGYGFHRAALERIASVSTLLISVDCGIASVDDVAAMAGKLDIIITDHHLPGEQLPPALAVVNPHRADCAYPDKNLCGVGVAYKLCEALYQSLKGCAYGEGLELVALGTVADIVPLVGENRKLVRLGLARMAETSRVGLRALMEIAGIDAGEVGAEQVGFQLAPRLNAAGRMERATLGARLLLTQDAAEAQELAQHLDALNRERQATEQDILRAAEDELASVDVSELPAIVLAGEVWHQGVIGIVASRVAESRYRPTLILTDDPAKGIIKGSGRSIPECDLHGLLESVKDILLGFGGHRQAAGLSIAPENLPLLVERFDAAVAASLGGVSPTPSLRLDATLPFGDVNAVLIRELSLLEPFGCGNPEPVFASPVVTILSRKAFGENHLALSLRDANSGVTLRGKAWRMADTLGPELAGAQARIAYSPKITYFSGIPEIELRVRDLCQNRS